MRRLTSLLFRSSATASMLAVLVLTPASTFAQRTPVPAAAPQNVVQPMFPAVDAPTPSTNVIQATTPPATAPAAGQNAPRAGQPTPQRASTPDPLGTRVAASTNVRLEMKISDTFTGEAVTKEVSMIIQSGNSGRIRTANVLNQRWPVNLNVDASTTAYANGVVRASVTFEYSPAPPKSAADDTTGPPPNLNESISVILQDGKPLIVSQSADPVTARKVTVELTATILK